MTARRSRRDVAAEESSRSRSKPTRGTSGTSRRVAERTSSRSESTSPRKNNKSSTILPIIPARVYKRWIFVSIILTLGFSWFCFPFFLDTKIVPEKLSQISEYLFEGALLRLIPTGRLFGDDFLGNVTSILQPFWRNEYESAGSPGKVLRAKGVRAKHPVVMIPGITSTGLELWEGQPCARSYFRQRLWGTLTMMRFMIMDGACWMQHLKLNSTTGGDPWGIKLRPAQGLEAADFILPGFWVWARIIENLAEIGYDHNNLLMAPYDWRLDILQLEQRDHYFSRLKSQIELLVKTRGEKVVILSHSLGGLVWLYFMKWVESDVNTSLVSGGGGGKDWVDKHIHAIGSIGAPYLGVPKAICMIMSGEMRDTAQMGKFESFLLDMLMNKQERLGLFRTWLGGFAMLPKGGNIIWGDGSVGSLVDTSEGVTYGLIHYNKTFAREQGLKDMYTADDIDEILSDFMPKSGYERLKDSYSWNGIAGPQEVAQNDDNPPTWINPLQSRLPFAPKMKIYCFYGVGKDTERAYEYEYVSENQWSDYHRGLNETERLERQRSHDIREILLRYRLNLGAADPSKRLSTGIYHVDGDGTVPTLSNGFMCAHAWRRYSHLNPSNLTVIPREYPHEPSGGIVEIRGGPKTSEHVDILGNHEMTMDILKIVSDFSEEEPVEERVLSAIREMADKIKMPF